MSDTTLNLILEDCRAIRSAHISLDDITVLTGINGSGKSTIARVFSSLIGLSANYDFLLRRKIWAPFADTYRNLAYLEQRLSHEPIWNRVRLDDRISNEPILKEELESELRNFETRFGNVVSQCVHRKSDSWVLRAMSAFLRAEDIHEDVETVWPSLASRLSQKIEDTINRLPHLIAKRRYDTYHYASSSQEKWILLAKKTELKEGGQCVFSSEFDKTSGNMKPNYNLQEIFGVKEAFYITSPLLSIPTIDTEGILHIPEDPFPHHKSGLELKETGGHSLFHVLGGTIQSRPSEGSLNLGDQSQWQYTRSDGVSFSLDECASGMKSLAILNILYVNGYLNHETLLIIDEPEAHLHPQWVFEYAKILVLIAKRLKVRLLLTSHSPDMVSAIQTISAAEEIPGVRFYLAEPDQKNKYCFQFRDVGTNVEPIFKTFNKAIDAIENYE